MGRREPPEPDAPCELLAWDSEFFGHRIGRVRGARLDAAAMARVERWASEEGVECLYFLADPSDARTSPLAERHGFHLVDVRVTLERRLPAATPPPPETATAGVRVRAAATADVPELRRIAAASHRDSRFYYDPRFARDRCDELYATWIEKSCGGGAAAVLVAEHEGLPAGYVTCDLPAGEGRIGLFAVGERAQGRGIGGLLIGAALAWFASHGAARVAVVTQARNVRAQRIYQKFGMLTREVGLWYHRWWPDEAAPAARAERR